MRRRTTQLAAIVTGLGLFLCAASASAWELLLDGRFVWNYDYLTQGGRAGFFGSQDVDAGNAGAATAGRFAPYNFWAGFHRNVGIVSGTDAAWQTIWMDTNVELRLNPAVRIRGRYHIGAWFDDGAGLGRGDLVASEYLTFKYGGVQRSFSPGYWNTLWLTAQLPWGIVGFGKRPARFGTGLAWNSEETRSSESLALTSFYGPFIIQFTFYPARRGTSSPTAQPYYNRDWDKNNGRLWDATAPLVDYHAGPFDIGIQFVYMNQHTGGEGVIPTAVQPVTVRSTDFTYSNNHEEFNGAAYAKYNNGRIFTNLEASWFYQTERTRGARPADINPGWNFRDRFLEHWRYAVEIGALQGPAKVSVLHAWLSGGDRRGDAAGRVGQIDRNGILASNTFANTGYFRPYSFLINYVYGAGMFQNADTTNGYMEDAVIYAGRLDYAVAANLNTFLTFMWAERASKSGFGWGCIRPVVPTGTTAAAGAVTIDRNRFNVPNIPDTNLGYEIDTGFEWKLLENLVVNLTVGYWGIGKWFNWACVDKGISGWNNTAASWIGLTPDQVGVNPNRSIDPVWGVELKINGTF